MGMNLTIHLEPEHYSDDDAEGFNWEGPGIYRFESSTNCRLLQDRRFNPILSANEQAIFEPQGTLGEYDRLQPQAPAAVRGAFMKVYITFAKDYEAKPERSGDDIARMHSLQRDIGGALAVCLYAEELGKNVYITLW